VVRVLDVPPHEVHEAETWTAELVPGAVEPYVAGPAQRLVVLGVRAVRPARLPPGLDPALVRVGVGVGPVLGLLSALAGVLARLPASGLHTAVCRLVGDVLVSLDPGVGVVLPVRAVAGGAACEVGQGVAADASAVALAADP